MSTVAEIVGRSLRMIGVVDPRQPVQDVDMQTGIVALNAMLRRWESNGVAMGWSQVANPSDTVQVPLEAEEAVAANLAMTLVAEYQVDPSPALISMAGRGYAQLLRDVMVAAPLRFEDGGRYYDIRSDGYYS